MDKYILVAGGLGYIGSHVVVVLIKAGYSVLIVDDLSNSDVKRCDEIKKVLTLEGFKKYSLKFEEIDLTDKKLTLELFSKYSINCVIALAGLKSVKDSTQIPIEYFSTNLSIISNLLLGMKTHHCNNLIFSSTGTVYNLDNPLPFKETDAIGKALTNAYSMSKYLIERMLEEITKYKKDINITCLRYFNPVGNHSSGLLADNPKSPTNLFPIITKSISTKTPFEIFGNDYPTPDGTCQRDYISVEDVASAHLVVLMSIRNDQSNYQVFNIGLGKAISVLEVVHTYERINGIKLNYVFSPVRPGDAAVTVGDPGKIKTLGWQPKRTLEDCVRQSYLSVTGF